jgi:cytochrome c2
MRINWSALAALAVVPLAGCSVAAPPALPGADGSRGKAAISRFGCGSCHTIPGINSAIGRVGPPLTEIRDRSYIAGMLPNSEANLERWIHDPKGVNPHTAMPTLGLTDRDAADIAAYLYSIP